MPQSPAKICAFPPCNRKTRKRYCTEHKKKAWNWSSKQDPWYNKPIWKGNPNKPLGKRGGLRERHLIENPYCVMCLEENGVYNDVTGKGQGYVDHIKPFRSAPTKQKQWKLFTDPDNLQTLCRHHNNIKSGQDGNIPK